MTTKGKREILSSLEEKAPFSLGMVPSGKDQRSFFAAVPLAEVVLTGLVAALAGFFAGLFALPVLVAALVEFVVMTLVWWTQQKRMHGGQGARRFDMLKFGQGG